ncbi:MAG: type II secretion system minor pseudopilin GspI [Spongiibacteraceae bacterium]
MKISSPVLRSISHRARGFTLVEVLVAVAIVALSITGILIAMMRQIDGTAYLRDKMFASYVAQNQMELALLTNTQTNQLPTDTLTGSEEMAGRTWYWRAQPKAVQQPGVSQLIITVSDVEGKDASPLATLDVLVDIYHRSEQ